MCKAELCPVGQHPEMQEQYVVRSGFLRRDVRAGFSTSAPMFHPLITARTRPLLKQCPLLGPHHCALVVV